MEQTTPAFMQCQLSLQEGGSLRIVNGAGMRLAVESGAVWLTQECDTRDWMLEQGRSHRLDRNGTAIVSALSSAKLTLCASRRGPLAAAWRELVAALRRYAAARRARSAERALLALDERTLRDIGVESWQPGLGQRLQEYRRRDALRLRATLLGQL